MSLWLQKRCVNKVTWSIEKYPASKLRISITEIIIHLFICFLILKALKISYTSFGFKLPVFCRCLAANSGQWARTAVARLDINGSNSTSSLVWFSQLYPAGKLRMWQQFMGLYFDPFHDWKTISPACYEMEHDIDLLTCWNQITFTIINNVNL